MTTIIVCPRCHRESLRSAPVRIVCRHAYHDAKDCRVCLECREGLVYDDASGTFVKRKATA